MEGLEIIDKKIGILKNFIQTFKGFSMEDVFLNSAVVDLYQIVLVCEYKKIPVLVLRIKKINLIVLNFTEF